MSEHATHRALDTRMRLVIVVECGLGVTLDEADGSVLALRFGPKDLDVEVRHRAGLAEPAFRTQHYRLVGSDSSANQPECSGDTATNSIETTRDSRRQESLKADTSCGSLASSLKLNWPVVKKRDQTDVTPSLSIPSVDDTTFAARAHTRYRPSACWQMIPELSFYPGARQRKTS